jgi:hypothetical protein
MAGVDEESERAYHVRRQRRSSTTLLVLLLMLGGALYYASTYYSASEPKPRPCTTVVPTREPKPAGISVSVYNATSRRGLAATVAKATAGRGFKIKEVSNDPLKKTVKGVAEIRYGPEGLSSAKVLAKHFPGAALLADKREGDTIDLVLGNTYKAIGPVPVAPVPTATLRPCPTVTVTPEG